VETLRNIPLLVQMFFWFYAGPMLFGETLGREINRISGLNVYVAIFGLGLYTASRVAEHMRAGFSSINRDQYQAVLVHRHDPGADVPLRHYPIRPTADHAAV
jgi:glutamate/aspartate transport system permease protein